MEAIFAPEQLFSVETLATAINRVSLLGQEGQALAALDISLAVTEENAELQEVIGYYRQAASPQAKKEFAALIAKLLRIRAHQLQATLKYLQTHYAVQRFEDSRAAMMKVHAMLERSNAPSAMIFASGIPSQPQDKRGLRMRGSEAGASLEKIDLAAVSTPDPGVKNFIPHYQARRLVVAPVNYDAARKILDLVVSKPPDEQLRATLRNLIRRTDIQIRFYLAPELDILGFIERVYTTAAVDIDFEEGPQTRSLSILQVRVVNAGLITTEQYWGLQEAANREGISWPRMLTRYLKEQSEFKSLLETFKRIVCELFRVRSADSISIDPVIDKRLSGQFNYARAVSYNILPVRRDGEMLIVVTSEPFDLKKMDDLKAVFSGVREVTPLYAHEHEVLELIEKFYLGGAGAEVESLAPAEAAAPVIHPGKVSILSVREDANPVIRFLSSLLIKALNMNASDIRIVPAEGGLSVRIHAGGSWIDILNDGKQKAYARWASPLVNLVLVLANLPHDQAGRAPMSGAFPLLREKTDGRVENIGIARVEVMNTIHGPGVTLRLLPKKQIPKLDDLGFHPTQLGLLEKLIHFPEGLIVVAGPTGGGKTTTLAAILNQISTPDRNVLTAEDPVEYEISHVTHVQVNPAVELTFAAALRSFLRQAPNVILDW